MLAKESVKLRINSEEGMGSENFSYQLLQGYDFLYLNEKYNVTMQLGGSDQWGNITAGTELIRKVKGTSVYGMTFPLLTRSDGQKFGKSEKGAIWLAPEKCSPYDFYQYFIRVADADVIKLMCLLTFMDIGEIREFERQMKLPTYDQNSAQRRLAGRGNTPDSWPGRTRYGLKGNQRRCAWVRYSIGPRDLEKHCWIWPTLTCRKDRRWAVKLLIYW